MLNIGRRLIHYARIPLLTMYSVEQYSRPNCKPAGLWVSVEGARDWPDFCQSNASDRLGISATEVILNPQANVLHIASAEEFDAFEKKYYLHANYDNPFTPFTGIDWNRVAQDYDGIVISPYRGDRRYARGGVQWYYTWDCASGCIWKKSAITELRLLTQTEGEGNVAAYDARTSVENN